MPFHPQALYGDLDDDPAEYATRSPVPIIHLLRQSDVRRGERTAASHAAADAAPHRRAELEWEGGDIPSANAERLRGVGAGALAGALAGFKRLAGLNA